MKKEKELAEFIIVIAELLDRSLITDSMAGRLISIMLRNNLKADSNS